jgi:hypothetical protein
VALAERAVRPVLVDVLLVFGQDDDCVTLVTSVRSSEDLHAARTA